MAHLYAHARTVAITRLLRQVAPAVHRRRGGRMPRQQQPDAIRLGYYRSLMPLIQEQTRYLKHAGQEILRLIEQEHAEQQARSDDEAERQRRLHQLLEHAGNAAADAFRPNAVHAVAEEYGRRTGNFQHVQLDKQVRQAVGVPLSAVEKPIRDLIPTFAKANVELVKTVAERYHDRLAADAIKAFESGEHPETFAQRLVELEDISESDARRIARDQIGKLNGQFNEERQTAMGVTSYNWRTSNDNRVRDEHQEREGRSFDWNDPPEDGNPGEPIQCRCYGEPDFSDIIDAL